ncbi:NlpC/P60 family protein [Azospirillum sp. B4]|uniref:NlpC/P60 family protein n=1 Tax=Azospirillum sp. B4 TaxID=95605 RepID=UPI000348FC10|nr:NlpC/P60 family protein [Azospirillum sp. B4]
MIAILKTSSLGKTEAGTPMIPAAALAPFVGLPYAHAGRGPEGYDCWGLVRHVHATVLGVELPSYLDEAYPGEREFGVMSALVAAHLDEWRPLAARVAHGQPLNIVAPVRTGDVALIRHGLHRCHVGIVVVAEERWGRVPERWSLLHIEAGTNRVAGFSNLEPLSLRYGNHVVGVYRFEGEG